MGTSELSGKPDVMQRRGGNGRSTSMENWKPLVDLCYENMDKFWWCGPLRSRADLP